MAFNPKIHHRRSIRLKGYDYSQSGLYFITICCKDRVHRFGKIENGEMKLNEFGEIAYNEWMNTPQLRPQIELDAFIVMPNHIHGILKINGRGELHSPHLNMDVRIQYDEQTNMKNELHSPHLNTDVKNELHSPIRSPSNNVGQLFGVINHR